MANDFEHGTGEVRLLVRHPDDSVSVIGTFGVSVSTNGTVSTQVTLPAVVIDALVDGELQHRLALLGAE